MTGVFMTSSGTEIGKTYVSCGLIAAALRAGRRVRAVKPVVSGFSSAKRHQSDSAILLKAQGTATNDAEIAAISPWRFEAALSPDMAAALEGRAIDFDDLCAFRGPAPARPNELLLIEGIGGVMVPLDRSHTVLDWISAVGMPAVLVVGSYLGTLSHSLTALAVLRQRGIHVAAVVVNETPGSAVALDATADVLRRHDPAPVTMLPRAASQAEQHGIFDRLATLSWADFP